jgi:hypothetical protein
VALLAAPVQKKGQSLPLFSKEQFIFRQTNAHAQTNCPVFFLARKRKQLNSFAQSKMIMRFLLLPLLFLLTICASAQKAPEQKGAPERYSQAWYGRKSHRQKVVAFAFVGSGLSLSLTGAFMLRHNAREIYRVENEEQRLRRESRERTGAHLAVGGVVLMAASIPYFVASARNGRLARLQVYSETAFLPDPAQRRSFAALLLQISL